MRLFFATAFVIYLGSYFYVAWRIISGLQVQSPVKIYIYIAVIAIGILGLAVMITSRAMHWPMSALTYVTNICMGALAISVTVFIANDIVNFANLFFKIQNFRYYSTIISLIIIAVLCLWSLINAALILKVREIKIPVANLPVEQLKVALISDIHITAQTSPKTINRIFDLVMAQKPDMVVIAGDITDTDLNANNKFLEYGFDKLKAAPYGVYAVTGNHEHYAGTEAFFEMFNKLGIKVLQNECVVANGKINIAGIEDVDHRNVQVIESTLAQTDKNLPVIFLSHRPESFDVASKQRQIVQLSGHTHAGQIPPIDIIRTFFMKYNYGIYKENGSTMYLTSGARFWGPPMRLFNASEIAIIVLEREAK